MINSVEAKRVINDIYLEIENSRGTYIWDDYVNTLKLIAQVVFTRSSGFILELIQNAEDAGLELPPPGVFQININKQRVKVIHNARTFNETDVRALCGVRSSKKPEKGTLGYLGIGFKSVFKITDAPEIYSNGFQFKYDRNYSEWKDPSKIPWHVIPIWIDQFSEPIDANKTVIIIPYREGDKEAYYSSLIEEVSKLKTELYLFLRWLRKIEIKDEVSGRSWTLENIGDGEEGISTLLQDGIEQKFKFFRKTLTEIPDWVKQDRLTQEYRANVTKREISVAFALDKEGNLAPFQAGAMYGGVYSFVPLGEARSGAKFPIQADFLAQPGRDAINYEAKWNQWLVEEVTKLCYEAINYFKNDNKWKNQFLPVFEFSKSPGMESYTKLFGPKLIEPIEDFLEQNDFVPTLDGGWTKPSNAIKILEDQETIDDLVNMRILKNEEIPSVMGGSPDLKLVSSEVKERDTKPFKKIDRLDILDNDEFLEQKLNNTGAPEWFRKLYLWLNAHPREKKSSKGKYSKEGYWDKKIVLDSDKKLFKGGEVWIPDLQPTDPILKDLVVTSKSFPSILHPDVLAGANEMEQKAIRSFLAGLTGVQILDAKTICKESLLPKIVTASSKPSISELIQYTSLCKLFLDIDFGKVELWVATKDDEVRAAKEVIFSKEFKPDKDWESNKKYLPGLNFVNLKYISQVSDPAHLVKWREFFKTGGVKENPDNGAYEFATNFAKEKLSTKYANVVIVDKRNYGYDIEADKPSGGKMRIEVKGITHDQDIELDCNETNTADVYKDFFYLCVVASIPENPSIHLICNPSVVGKKDKVTISPDIWKAATL